MAEQINFLNIAAGSASELECQVLLSGDLGFIPIERVETYVARIAEIRRMLHGMMASLQRTRNVVQKRPP